MSVLERCPSYRESNKGSKERQEPNLGVRFGEVSVQREATVLPKGGVERKPVANTEVVDSPTGSIKVVSVTLSLYQ